METPGRQPSRSRSPSRQSFPAAGEDRADAGFDAPSPPTPCSDTSPSSSYETETPGRRSSPAASEDRADATAAGDLETPENAAAASDDHPPAHPADHAAHAPRENAAASGDDRPPAEPADDAAHAAAAVVRPRWRQGTLSRPCGLGPPLAQQVPSEGDAILVLRPEYLDLILAGLKTIEIRDKKYANKAYWLGSEGFVHGIVNMTFQEVVDSKERWLELFPQHFWDKAELPYKKTCVFRLSDVAQLSEPIPYWHKRGAVGIARFAPR